MFLFDYSRSEDSQPQVVTAPDARALFLPRGRRGPAYEIPSHWDGYELERRMKWLSNGLIAGVVVVVAAAALTETWWILFLLLIVALLRPPVEAGMLSGLRLAEDSIAVAAASSRERGNAIRSLLATAVVVAWYLWNIPSGGRRTTATLVAALIAVAFATLERCTAGVRMRSVRRTCRKRRRTSRSFRADDR